MRLRTIHLLIVTLCLGVLFTATPKTALAAGGHDKHAHGAVNLQKAKGDACIKDTEWMRRNHMKLLMHKRAVTVREGVRTPAESLLECRACHEKREAFCDRCHSYVGVKPDCFECHNY